ncbi:GNAT family N-acetyltransferase [Marininema mesophilum]|nr:GNAT family N-acetyltransferase [Marininema mesophilum]
MANILLKEFPNSFKTERLLIRLPLPGDGVAVHEGIRETQEELRPWMPWAQVDQNVEDIEVNVRKAHIRFIERSDLRFHLFLKESGEFVGIGGLHCINWEVPRVEIGYWCRKRYMGQGLISEAVQGLTNFAIQQLGVKRVEIRCDSENHASRRVAERTDFILEGILRQFDRSPDGEELRDVAVYSIVVKE